MPEYSLTVKRQKFYSGDVRVLVHKLLQAGPRGWDLQMSPNKRCTSTHALLLALELNASLKVPALISTLFS